MELIARAGTHAQQLADELVARRARTRAAIVCATTWRCSPFVCVDAERSQCVEALALIARPAVVGGDRRRLLADCKRAPRRHTSCSTAPPTIPSVLIWDSRARLRAYHAASFDVAQAMLPHALLVAPGTHADVVSCVPSYVESPLFSIAGRRGRRDHHERPLRTASSAGCSGSTSGSHSLDVLTRTKTRRRPPDNRTRSIAMP